ncbi:MAG: ATP-binding protein [Ferruginibacter sp.]
MAQHNAIDSLREQLGKTTDLKKRYDLLEKMNGIYYRNGNGNNPVDNSLEMVRIALQLKDDNLIAKSYNAVGDYYAFLKNDNTAALDYFFKAIPYAEKIKNGRALSSLYSDMGVAYSVLGNTAEQLKSLEKAEASLPDTLHPDYQYLKLQALCNYGSYYAITKNAPKLLVYLKAAAAINAKLKYSSWELLIKALYADYYAQIGKKDSATQMFKQVLELDKVNQFLFAHFTVAYYYIPFLIDNNELGEAKNQANHLMQLGIENNNNFVRLRSSEYLRMAYDKEGKVDSAYHFAKVALTLKDTVLNQTLLNKVQALNFNEEVRLRQEEEQRRQRILIIVVLSVLAVFALIAVILYRNSRQRKKANTVLQKTLTNLKSTQSQLIQSEKMASLGELTAGIAHEIQNPLNFVNNFSDVNKELLGEMNDEIDKGNYDEVKLIAKDVTDNEEKINHHGKRADAIVKGMLQHSRTTGSVKEPADINKLADEYLRLAYHGFRAKDNSFNATMKTDFDASIGNINIIPQDIGRVILNLITNAFYVVNEKRKGPLTSKGGTGSPHGNDYEPTVTVSTALIPPSGGRGATVEIKVSDNGNGIPKNILEKIFQPFFTTKPAGQGTGLGLSLSYDIIKAHGGELKAETKEGEFAAFVITLPI